MQPSPALQRAWDVPPEEARAIQRELARHVEREDRIGEIKTVAGIDLGFPRTGTDEVMGRAALVIMRYPELEVIEERVVHQPVTFPYIPGLLSFRELPVALAAFAHVEHPPDLVLVDGHGLAHPRRFGIACHLGVLLDVPTIGCAKSILVGRAADPGPNPGDWTPLVDRGETIGAALRTTNRGRPLYVATGHRVSLDTARELVMTCWRGYRLPEPTRLADRLASQRDRAPADRLVPDTSPETPTAR
jgi:deoxyribonuclease V